MSKKKNKNLKKYPFSNEIKKLKDEFKQLIDSMPDDEFLDMISILTIDFENIEDDFWNYDEDWESEAEKFYNQNNFETNNLFNDDDLPF